MEGGPQQGGEGGALGLLPEGGQVGPGHLAAQVAGLVVVDPGVPLQAQGGEVAAQPLFLFTLPLWLSLEGVWVAYPAAVMLTAAAAFVLMRRHLALLPASE